MNKNLITLRKDKRMSQRDVAKVLDITPVQYGNYERGSRSIPQDKLLILSKLFNVSVDYILDNVQTQEEKLTQTNPRWKEIDIQPVPEFTEESFQVPVVATLRCGYNSAGQPLFDVLKKEEVPLSYKRRYGEDIVMVKAIGDSMLPSIRPRDMLICKPGEGWNNGDIVVINVDDSDTIKRIYRAKDGGIDLIPDNDAFKTMHFTPDDLISYPPHVLGKVIRNYGQDL